MITKMRLIFSQKQKRNKKKCQNNVRILKINTENCPMVQSVRVWVCRFFAFCQPIVRNKIERGLTNYSSLLQLQFYSLFCRIASIKDQNTLIHQTHYGSVRVLYSFVVISVNFSKKCPNIVREVIIFDNVPLKSKAYSHLNSVIGSQ